MTNDYFRISTSPRLKRKRTRLFAEMISEDQEEAHRDEPDCSGKQAASYYVSGDRGTSQTQTDGPEADTDENIVVIEEMSR
jgi:hypothetical protein